MIKIQSYYPEQEVFNMRRHQVSLLVILPLIMIIFLPSLSLCYQVIADKREIKQNEDDTYSLNATIKIVELSQKLDIKLAIKITKADGTGDMVAIAGTDDGLYTFRTMTPREITNYVIPNSKDIFLDIKEVTLIYTESGKEEWHELTNGKITQYIDKEGLPKPFSILPKKLNLRILKVNGNEPINDKVSLSPKKVSDLDIELEIFSKGYVKSFDVKYSYILDTQKPKIGGNITITESLQKETIKYKWNGERRIGVQVSVGNLASNQVFVDITPKSGFYKLWWILIPIVVVIVVFLIKPYIKKQGQNKNKKLGGVREPWLSKLLIKKPIEIQNKSLEFSEEKKRFSLSIPKSKYNEKPDWLIVRRNPSDKTEYLFELVTSSQQERNPGIITFNDKKGNTICNVRVSYNNAQVSAENTDRSDTAKNIMEQEEIIKNRANLTNARDENIDKKEEYFPPSASIDNTSILKNDGDRVVVILKPDNDYKEEIRVISEVKPELKTELRTKVSVKGNIYHSGIDREWTVSLSIEKNYQRQMHDDQLKIIVTYTIHNGIRYVICKLPEQSFEDTPPKPTNLTLEFDGQTAEFQVSKDSIIKIEMKRGGQLRTDQANNPQKIIIPTKTDYIDNQPRNTTSVPADNLRHNLITGLNRVLSNQKIDEQVKTGKRTLLTRMLESPNDPSVWMEFIGLNEEKSQITDSKPKEPSFKSEDENEASQIEEETKEEIKFGNNKLTQVLIALKNEINKSSYDEKDSDIETLNSISNTISSDDFSIDDSYLRSLINWSINFYKRKNSNEGIWSLFVEKMRDIGIFVIYKDNVQYNENDHIVREGPRKDAVVDKVVEPGFKTSAEYAGTPRVIEQAVVITSSRY